MKLQDESWLKSPQEIHNGAVDFFNQFLAQKQVEEKPKLSSLVMKIILDDENVNLVQLPSIQMVKEAIFSISMDSSPGPDRFGSGFYQSCWNIVGADVAKVVQDFFSGADMPMYFSASFLVLIPKVESPTSFDKFRPISLCSMFYKICSKILVSRLAPLFSRLVSLEQGAFISGRSIFENINLTQELVHSINKPVRGGNIMLKIDMAKTYDSVDWSLFCVS